MSELREQLELARQRLAHSRELLARTNSVRVLPYPEAVFPEAGSREPSAVHDGTQRTFPVVSELIERIEAATACDADVAGRLVEEIICAIKVVAEPSLLMGLLLEGIAETVLERLPEGERRETAIGLCALLWDRINRGATE